MRRAAGVGRAVGTCVSGVLRRKNYGGGNPSHARRVSEAVRTKKYFAVREALSWPSVGASTLTTDLDCQFQSRCNFPCNLRQSWLQTAAARQDTHLSSSPKVMSPIAFPTHSASILCSNNPIVTSHGVRARIWELEDEEDRDWGGVWVLVLYGPLYSLVGADGPGPYPRRCNSLI